MAWKEELNVVKATEGHLDDFANVTADVLLMCGTDTTAMFTDTLDALESMLPRSSRVEPPGL